MFSKGKSLQSRQLPLLWSNKDDSYSELNNRRAHSRSLSPKNEDYDDIKVVEEDQDIEHHRVFLPRPPKNKSLKKIRFRRRHGTGNNVGSRGYSAVVKNESGVFHRYTFYHRYTMVKASRFRLILKYLNPKMRSLFISNIVVEKI